MSNPTTTCCPLSQPAAAIARRWYIPPLTALLFALVAAAAVSLRAPVYESHVILRINYRAEIQTLKLILSTAPPTPSTLSTPSTPSTSSTPSTPSSPAALAQTMDRYAEEFVRLTGNRILRENQTMEQFLTSYQINTLARLAHSDAIWSQWQARMRKDLPPEQAAELDRTNPQTLRNKAFHVRRSKPESVVEIAFEARHPETARLGAAALAAILIEAEQKDRDARRQKALDAADAQNKAAMKHLLDEPALEQLESASAPLRIAPAPLSAAARAALAGFLIAVLMLGVFPARKTR
ncbi:MAG: hypothetical protein NTX50_19815 [Candidatus Sumerlaeota bacterium]|nr:hypothetical protein [Candidatus Sumerlaeota bacterium]